MRLKLYRAAKMAEAMAHMRAELGPDALILSSRRVSDGVEITAAMEDAPQPIDMDAAAHRDRGLVYHGTSAVLRDALATGALPEALHQNFRFAPLELGSGARPMMFVGPPGAGKTLTVARLATRLVMAGTSPLVITADGRRAGAAEQLAAFTRLLGLNLLVASQPAALSRALTTRQGGAPVLIDMPGSNPFDATERQELQDFAAIAQAHMAFVMPAGLAPREAGEMAEAYATIGARYLVVTRMDVARRLGCILAAAAAGLALAEAGIGPGAADGLVPMTPTLLAKRLLDIPSGQEGRIDVRH